MHLVSFTIENFRSINESGEVAVAKRTCLVGRNESGKTALLKALHGIKGRHVVQGKPEVQERIDFTLARDFPRDRPRSAFNPDTVVATTRWELTNADRVALGKLWARASAATHAEVSRKYKVQCTVGFDGTSELSTHMADGRKAAEKLAKSLRASFKAKEEVAAPVEAALDALEQAVKALEWDKAAAAANAKLRSAVPGAGLELTGPAQEALAELDRAISIVVDDEAHSQAARDWVMQHLPVFVYLDEWEQVTGHHVINEYVARRQNGNRQPQDHLFDKLLKVAELNAEELAKLLPEQHEERTLLTDRASRVFTKRLRELWKDRDIDVQFRLDAQHFDVLVKDRDTDALVPLDERSRGFRWYFSFYVTFSADTLGGDKENAILLLDEPGLFLHATAQAQLLKFFRQLKNQVIYSTHSPFMVDPNELGSVRTVMLEPATGTQVSADLTGDARTLFPLQAALGYDITQTLFVGTKNVVVEGVTDYWYLSSVADYLRDQGKATLPADVVLTPAGGAQKVSYLVSLLASQNLNVVVLLDTEPCAERTLDDLVKSKLVRSDAVLHVAEAFASPPKEADVEDLVDPTVFMGLVNEVYKTELAGKTLIPNLNIPRIVPRLEAAFTALGLSFAKSRVASLFMRRMATDPAKLLAGGGDERFGKLLLDLGKAVEKLGAADRAPFA